MQDAYEETWKQLPLLPSNVKQKTIDKIVRENIHYC